MWKALKTLILLAMLFTIAYYFWPEISARFLAPAPCTEPIPYALGTFDTKFNISKEYFLSALSDAEKIWEKSAEKNLFTYAPENTSKSDLKVNLVYDYRQQATSKLASLGIVVEDNRASYDRLKIKFEALQKEYEREKSDFETQEESFNQKNRAYEKEVESWNRKGGAPEKEFNRLEQERLALRAESTELKTLQANVNNMADELSALVVALNRLVDSLNLSVNKYNTTAGARGESFEEGVYYSDGGDRAIDIYEFENRTKLVRVLAHELGHALGIEHVADPKSIMYEKNQGSSLVLSGDDLTALDKVCKEE